LLGPVSRDTLTHQVKDAIKRFIIMEDLESGARLPTERELSESMSVSRNIIREALSVLEAEDVIERQVGRGTFVGKFDRKQLMTSVSIDINDNDISMQTAREARAAMEIGAVGLIVERITDEEIENLKSILEVCERKYNEGKSPVKEDIDFHLALLNATRNKIIQDMAPLVMDVFRQRLLEAPSAMRDNPQRIINEHRQIIAALENRDVVTARAVMQLHFRLQDFPI